MPAVSPNIIVKQLIDAIQQSGGVAAYVSESVRMHPRKFDEIANQAASILRGSTSETMWIILPIPGKRSITRLSEI